MSRPAKLLLFAAAALIIALAIVAALRWRSTSRALDISTRTRAIHQALVSYSQNNQDRFPPPDRVVTTLVESGLITADTFNMPGTPQGEPSLFYIAPTADKERWGNSFRRSEPVLYTNPSIDHGAINVAWNDNHVEYLDPSAAAKLLAEYSSRAVPLKSPQ